MPKIREMSHLEREFALWLRQSGVDGWVTEHRFAPPRRWRFDFAWLDAKLAVEVDGLLHGRAGGHQSVNGIVGDREKSEAALLLGWRVYHVPGPWIAVGRRRIWRPATICAIKELLGR